MGSNLIFAVYGSMSTLTIVRGTEQNGELIRLTSLSSHIKLACNDIIETPNSLTCSYQLGNRCIQDRSLWYPSSQRPFPLN